MGKIKNGAVTYETPFIYEHIHICGKKKNERLWQFILENVFWKILPGTWKYLSIKIRPLHSVFRVLSNDVFNFGPDTNSSQFFISSIALPYFDDKYVE
jgi:hypothetical protein